MIDVERVFFCLSDADIPITWSGVGKTKRSWVRSMLR